jgi:hypothetical protein
MCERVLADVVSKASLLIKLEMRTALSAEARSRSSLFLQRCWGGATEKKTNFDFFLNESQKNERVQK